MSLQNLIKLSEKLKTLDPNIIEIEFLGKAPQPATKINPYGLFNNPKDESNAIVFEPEANEDSLLALPIDPDNSMTLDDSEVAIGIPTQKARIKFKNDDTIIFTIGDTEGGDFAVRYTPLETAYNDMKDKLNDLIEKFNLHIHTTTATIGATPTVGVISPTTSTETPATTLIDDAKIKEIEVPEV